jgi:hypothetical protein
MPDCGTGQPLPNGIATVIRLGDDVDCLNPIQVPSVALLPPVRSAGYAKGRNPVKSKGVAVGFAFDQDDLSRLLHLGKTVEAVQARLGPRFPTKTVTVERNTETHCELFTSLSEIGEAHRQFTFEGELGQSTALEKIDRQPFRGRIAVESQSRSTSLRDPAPGGGTFRHAWGPILNDNQQLLFVGDLTPPPGRDMNQGLFLYTYNGLTVSVVRPGDTLPDGKLVTVSNTVTAHHLNNRGEISFLATLDTGREALYVKSDDKFRLVAKTGGVLPGIGTIRDFGDGPPLGFVPLAALNNDRGQVLFLRPVGRRWYSAYRGDAHARIERIDCRGRSGLCAPVRQWQGGSGSGSETGCSTDKTERLVLDQ